MNYEELKEEVRDARRALDSKCEETMERLQQMQGFSRVLEAAEQALDENAGLREEVKELREQLLEEKDLRTKAEIQLKEMSQLSAGVAKKASQDELLKAIRVFVNKSKRKKIEKRIAVKEMVLEMVNANGIVLPEDLALAIDALDDEQTEARVVNVQGNYNDIHDNTKVNIKDKEE